MLTDIHALADQFIIALPNINNRQFAQPHRLVLLEADVLPIVEVKMVLAVSGLLVKKGMIPLESVTLEEERKVVLSSGILLVTWCSWGLFS